MLPLRPSISMASGVIMVLRPYEGCPPVGSTKLYPESFIKTEFCLRPLPRVGHDLPDITGKISIDHRGIVVHPHPCHMDGLARMVGFDLDMHDETPFSWLYSTPNRGNSTNHRVLHAFSGHL